MNRQYEIIMVADLLPTPSNYNSFIDGNLCKTIDVKLLQTLNNADFRFFNLEGPLITDKTPILKDGPT